MVGLCKKKKKTKKSHVSIFEKYVLYTRFNIIFICLLCCSYMKK